MERIDFRNIEYVMAELERIKVEIQRLEALLVPLVKEEVSPEELDEIEREAREFKEDEWVDANELEELLEDDS
ncbi:DUF5646 family protein [Thermococcus atlanticus]